MQRFISKTCWITLLLLAALGLSLGSFNAIYAAWDTPITVDSNSMTGWFNSMKVVGINPAIAYYDVPNGDLKFVRATDTNGSAWGTPLTLDSTGRVGLFPSLAVVNGYPAVSYYDSTNKDLKYVRATNATGSSWGTPITVDNSEDAGNYYTSLKVVNGYPAISYRDGDNGYLKFVRATDASGNAWGTPVTVVSSGDAGMYSSLAVVDGYPAISYFEYSNYALKYVRATDAIGSAWGSPITLDDSDDLWVGQYTSLEVVDGYPAISYFVGDSLGNVGYLKYVRATNASGIAWGNPLTLDGPHAGEYDSLAVVNGYPAISYYDASSGHLKYIQALDASGSAWGDPVVADSSEAVGQSTSLAVVSGYPAISYYDNYNGHLKYVRYIPAPEISVTGNGVEIVNGDTTPDAADHTDFGSVAPGGSLTRTFTIRNKGLLNLIINNINLSGDAAGDFTISGITSSVVLSAGSSVTFQVIFSPTITGTRTATVSIDSNDITKHPYWFAIQGKCQNADPLKGLYLPLINSSN